MCSDLHVLGTADCCLALLPAALQSSLQTLDGVHQALLGPLSTPQRPHLNAKRLKRTFAESKCIRVQVGGILTSVMTIVADETTKGSCLTETMVQCKPTYTCTMRKLLQGHNNTAANSWLIIVR